ncbi:MAG TPA: peptidoglycan-binding protein [Thermohalobaculum sp.]|nr:peptidoglycan-binding protein [Thermohalobaculum sp.]
MFAVVGLVCGTIAWTMSAQDPYWKLYGSSSLPAPVYETAEADVPPQEFTVPGPRNPETAAVSPEPAADDPAHSALVRAAETVHLPAPMLASIPPLDDSAVTERAARATSYAFASPGFVEPAAFLPEVGAALVLSRDPGDPALTPFVAPSAPEQPRMAASPETEEALGLTRSARTKIQRRLALAGFDPRGVDGVFGPNTRDAISDFQTAWGFPATGYLEESVQAELNRRTEDAYQAMVARAAAVAEPAPEPVIEEPEIVVAEGKCARHPDGRIIAGLSLGCDMAGFAQQFATLGRTVIGKDNDGAPDSAQADATTAAAGGETAMASVETTAATTFVPRSTRDR